MLPGSVDDGRVVDGRVVDGPGGSDVAGSGVDVTGGDGVIVVSGGDGVIVVPDGLVVVAGGLVGLVVVLVGVVSPGEGQAARTTPSRRQHPTDTSGCARRRVFLDRFLDIGRWTSRCGRVSNIGCETARGDERRTYGWVTLADSGESLHPVVKPGNESGTPNVTIAGLA